MLFPRAQFHIIPSTGHFVMLQAPTPVNVLIEGFLAGIAF
jgi:pimeloyl-ACP methyl ester carboxylesterase